MTDDAMPIDIYTEPEGDPNTLANLGPLRSLAGVWRGEDGVDTHPSEEGNETEPFIEDYTAQPIDFQTNGPQLLYGLRYAMRATRPGEVDMFHEQVGFWLWEPAAQRVILTIAIPRGQVALASGHCAPDATTFTVTAERGDTTWGIASNPFLDEHFTTERFEMTVTTRPDGTWSYEEHTWMRVTGREALVDHVDRNQYRLVAAPTPNPMALAATAANAITDEPAATAPLS